MRNLVALIALVCVACAGVRVRRTPVSLEYFAGGVTVSVSPCFHSSIYVPRGQGCDNEPYMQLVTSGLGALLTSGKLTPARLSQQFRTSLERRMVKVINLTEEARDDGRTVIIRLESTPDEFEDGWGEMQMLEVEVMNPAVSVTADRARFFKGARVVDVRYAGSMI